jgi:hypothetical protein
VAQSKRATHTVIAHPIKALTNLTNALGLGKVRRIELTFDVDEWPTMKVWKIVEEHEATAIVDAVKVYILREPGSVEPSDGN